MGEILSPDCLIERVRSLQQQGRRVVFTNGCFDLLHVGHVRYLRSARGLGDCLVVALNSDASVRAIKGAERPIIPQGERAELLAALSFVDYVTIFEEPDPSHLIALLQPNVLVKGGDWTPEQIVGREEVETRGGKVFSLPLVEGTSSSSIIRTITERYGKSLRNSLPPRKNS
jgi:D-beta-D-heptose 7-phosphate kinase/D-beta-D-heptose 1-phosphate adenosyltransferase